MCFEQLSNDIIMEIFDYFYADEIYFMFYNLNSRLNSVYYYYPNLYINTTKQLFNRKNIKHLRNSFQLKNVRSLKYSEEKWASQISTKYFTSLHSLIFNNVENVYMIELLLRKLPSPNQLYYLSLNTLNDINNLENLLIIIFQLSNLTHLILDFCSVFINFRKINHPSLSLRYFSTRHLYFQQTLKFIHFMPNLISLSISLFGRTDIYDKEFTEPECFSKLKKLRIIKVREFDDIRHIFELCPQMTIFQIECYNMIEAKDWEDVLLPMERLKRIRIEISFYHKIDIDLVKYETDFWKKRNIKASLNCQQDSNIHYLILTNSTWPSF